MTTLPDEKTPASEIERTQVLLQDRKRIAFADLRKEKKVRCLGRGPDAEWERING